MDSITQAVLGATLQAALLGRWQGRKALLYGAALATLPDLDVVIDYGDAVAGMTYHRSFSHSLLVLTGLALALTLLLRWRPHPGYSAGRLFVTLWLVLATHPLLDAFTSYGTQLFWPFTPTPTAWSTVFIIDPLYTAPLLVAVIGGLVHGLRDKPPRLPLLALALSSLYLGFTVAGKQMAEHAVEKELARQGIHADALFSGPTPFNSLLWRVIVRDGADYHEAVVGWFDRQPPRIERFARGTGLRAVLADSPQEKRLEWFTGDWLRYDEIGGQLIVTDLRLGMTGFHPFRFPLAERRDGQWQLIPYVERLPMERGGAAQMKLIWARIWHQQPPLPLREWAETLKQTSRPVGA